MASFTSGIALHAAFQGNLSLLKKLGEKVDLRGVKDADGDTPLHGAALGGRVDICRFLVGESGVDVNSASKTGVTPMSNAAREGNVQVMRYLLDRGADPAMPDEMGSTPLHRAAQEGAPLHLAAANDNVEVVKVLLEHAADINKVVYHFLSPLMLACFEKSLKCIKLLIEAGADVNAPGYSVSTPLTLAVDNGLTDIVKLLLEAGADPNIPNMFGAIPIEKAAAHHRREIVEVLFPRTKPIPSLPDWSVDGIIGTVNSPRYNPQAAVSVEEIIADWKSRGKEAFAKEDYLTAGCFFGKVLDINPSDAAMYANKSLCWLRMRYGDLALEEAQKCIMRLPRWSKAWYRKGSALSFMKDYEGAAKAFQEALQLDPRSEEITEALRKAEQAEEELQRV